MGSKSVPREDFESCVGLLLERGARADEVGVGLAGLFVGALWWGMDSVWPRILEAGRHMRGRNGETAFHRATFLGQPEHVRWLLDAGGREDVNVADNTGKTPLHIAVDLPRYDPELPMDMSRLRLDAGADVGATDVEGRTPLFRAAVARHWDVIELLLQRGADIDHKDRRGWTLLDHALDYGQAALFNGLRGLGRTKGAAAGRSMNPGPGTVPL